VRALRITLTAGGYQVTTAGVLMPSGCRMGICFTCVATLRSGRVRDLRTGDEHGDEGDLIQTCVSAAAGPVEIHL
jgi:ferredoxin